MPGNKSKKNVIQFVVSKQAGFEQAANKISEVNQRKAKNR